MKQGSREPQESENQAARPLQRQRTLGGAKMRLADLEAALQQRGEALTAFSKTTPVDATRPCGGITDEETTEHEGSERNQL